MRIGKTCIETCKSSPPVTISTSITETVNGSHQFRITGYSLWKGVGIGKYIASDTFIFGGYAWAIYFYPDRKNMDDNGTYLSLFITLISEGMDVRALFKLTLMDLSGKNAYMVHSHFGRAMDGGPYTLKYRGSVWCEAMSTYPRTYDLLHANSVFSLYKDRCEMEDILLEMDKILRPEGTVIFRDDIDILLKIKSITDALQWESRIVDHEDSPHNREKLLVAVKLYWTAPAPAPADEPQTES